MRDDIAAQELHVALTVLIPVVIAEHPGVIKRSRAVPRGVDQYVQPPVYLGIECLEAATTTHVLDGRYLEHHIAKSAVKIYSYHLFQFMFFAINPMCLAIR